MIVSYFSLKPYVVTTHLNRPVETVQMRGHNIYFYAELTKIVPSYHQILLLIYSSDEFLPGNSLTWSSMPILSFERKKSIASPISLSILYYTLGSK